VALKTGGRPIETKDTGHLKVKVAADWNQPDASNREWRGDVAEFTDT